VVIAFDGLKDYDFRDYIAGGLRMANGGYSRLPLDFTAAVIAAFPQSGVSVIGHSAGGNVASFVDGAFRLPSILFSPSRGEAGLVGNDGSMQLTVIVRGDIIADHDPPLPGITLYLDKAEGRPHQIETVIDALLAVIEG